MKRQLYQCLNAKVMDSEVYCAKGQYLGKVTILSIARGAPLHIAICQACLDYDEMGSPLMKADRGWPK